MKMVEITTNMLDKLKGSVKEIFAHCKYTSRMQALIVSEKKTAEADFWQVKKRAQAFLEKLKKEKKILEELDHLQASLEELLLAYDFWKKKEVSDQTLNDTHKVLLERLSNFEMQQMMVGDNDQAGAIIEIHSGAGGVDSQDWANMLLRMYTLWGDQKDYKTTMIYTQTEEIGIKSAMLKIEGNYVYGQLRGETGVHRLVRLSPYDAQHKRHTSFASVHVYPAIENDITIEVDPNDLAWETLKSGGPGGQHANKVETSVRVKHLPTGITIICKQERSQLQNKNRALALLKLRLYDQALNKKNKAKNEILKQQKDIEFGSQIRNYVLHPYKLVKDKLSGYATKNVTKVLAGHLDPFLKASLLSTKKQL